MKYLCVKYLLKNPETESTNSYKTVAVEIWF